MIINDREVATRVIVMAVGGILLLVFALIALNQCQKRRSEAAQERVEEGQAAAASNSSADAIGTVAASGEAAAASEDLTRTNAGEIMAAPGAGDKINPATNLAGRKATCRRAAYRDRPECKELNR